MPTSLCATPLTVPHPVPSPTEDAESLRKAFEGWGTNEKALISLIAHRDATQRKLIRVAYEELYGEDLIKRLESEITGDFEKAIYRWIFDPVEREAILAYVAVKKSSPIDSRVIVEIACVGSPDELLAVKKAYHFRYKHSLEEEIAAHTTGDLRKLLVALVGTYRYDGNEVDTRVATSEAKILHEAIEDKAFAHEELIRILSTRSKAQLNATFNRYRDEYGANIIESLPSDPENQYAIALGAAIQCIKSPHEYFEKLLRNVISKRGTDEDTITRVIVTRAEKDLKVIKDLYYKNNSVDLARAIIKETAGDYEAFLVALLGE